MLTKQQIQDTVIDHLSLALQDQITIRERISEAFINWFQDVVQVPMPPAQEGAGGGGAPGAQPAVATPPPAPEDTSGEAPPQ